MADDERPQTDSRDPAWVINECVSRSLSLVATWVNWDGEPVSHDGRVYTPHKAARRLADHLTDHLAEVSARLAGEKPFPDEWHGSVVTTPADLAPFTAEDANETRSRLTRLAQMWELRLRSLTDAQLDEQPGDTWSIREIAFHTAESLYYAESVGEL